MEWHWHFCSASFYFRQFFCSSFGWKMWRDVYSVIVTGIKEGEAHQCRQCLHSSTSDAHRLLQMIFVYNVSNRSNALFKCPSFSWICMCIVQWLLRRLYLSICFFPSFHFVLCSNRQNKRKKMWKFVGIQRRRHTEKFRKSIKPLSGLWCWLLLWGRRTSEMTD